MSAFLVYRTFCEMIKKYAKTFAFAYFSVGNAGNPFLVSFDEIFVRADFFNLFFGFCEFPNFVLD